MTEYAQSDGEEDASCAGVFITESQYFVYALFYQAKSSVRVQVAIKHHKGLAPFRLYDQTCLSFSQSVVEE